MLTVEIPRPKLRVYKCNTEICSGDGAHWVADAGMIGYNADTWAEAMSLAVKLARRSAEVTA